SLVNIVFEFIAKQRRWSQKLSKISIPPLGNLDINHMFKISNAKSFFHPTLDQLLSSLSTSFKFSSSTLIQIINNFLNRSIYIIVTLSLSILSLDCVYFLHFLKCIFYTSIVYFLHFLKCIFYTSGKCFNIYAIW